MGTWIKNNPVWFIATVEALVVAIMNLLLEFAVHVTTGQQAAINGVVMVVLTLALGLWAQAPLTKLIDQARDEGFTRGLTAKHD